MALSIHQTVALRQFLSPGMKVASMGYPDTIAPLPLFEEMLGGRFGLLRFRDDSEAICRRHGIPLHQVPDAESFFNLMGTDLTVFDIIRERGCEVLIDLNEPYEHSHKFDVVLDVGTTEHCFNVYQAMKNMAGMVKVGGIIIHENPFNCGNHGFYNLNPTFFKDFYEANGFKILECSIATKDGRGSGVPLAKRFRFFHEEVNVFAVAERVEEKPFVCPVQSKYQKKIPDAGDRATKERLIHV